MIKVSAGLIVRVFVGVIALILVFMYTFLACIAYTKGLYGAMAILVFLGGLASFSFILAMTSYDKDKDIIAIMMLFTASLPYMFLLIDQIIKLLNNLLEVSHSCENHT